MNKLDTIGRVGIPTPVAEHIESDETSYNDNLYVVKLKTPLCNRISGVTYPETVHVFTEKELYRATVRYYNDVDEIIGRMDANVSDINKSMLGYVGVHTYTNGNGVLTTRFIIRFDGSYVPGMRKGSCIGLFTARELKRSECRAKNIFFDKLRWFKALWHKLKGRWHHVQKHAR